MAITLSVEDLRLLGDAQQALLGPLVHDEPHRWADQVVRRVARLLRADGGVFQVQRRDEPPLASLFNVEPSTVQAYADHYVHRELLPASAEPAVHYLPDATTRTELEESEIYNDFWKPTKQFDNIAVVAPLDENAHAAMFFHHRRQGGRVFGERGKTLMRMLLPVMASAAQEYMEWQRRHRKLFRFIDRVEDGLLLYDTTGAIRHANPSITELLAGDSERSLVRSRAEALARRMAALRTDRETLTASPAGSPVLVETSRRAYRLRGTYLEESAVGGPGVLITVRGASNSLPQLSTLRSRFDLTARQAEVALLLAQRKTNDEIAETLVVSPHTVRRHTENVFLKLGISSRRDVRSAITA